MNLDQVILQLKQVPIFAGNVAGAADFANGVMNQAWLPLPAAYAVQLEDEAGENQNLAGSYQIMTERIAVIVVFDNSAAVISGERRGQSVSSLLEPTKWSIFKVLLNWRPDSTVDNPTLPSTTLGADHSARGLYYTGGTLRDEITSAARLAYQWTFAHDVTITGDDGWHPTGVPLVDIAGNLTDPQTGKTTVGLFDVPLPTS